MTYKIIEYSNPIKNEIFHLEAANLDELSTLLLDHYNMDNSVVNFKESDCYSYAFNITKSLDFLFKDNNGSLVLTGLHSGFIEIIE